MGKPDFSVIASRNLETGFLDSMLEIVLVQRG
jgi:hypothetical protein